MIFHFLGEKSKMAPKRTRHNPNDEALPRDAPLASIHEGEGGQAGNVVGALSFKVIYRLYEFV